MTFDLREIIRETLRTVKYCMILCRREDESCVNNSPAAGDMVLESNFTFGIFILTFGMHLLYQGTLV